MFWPINASSDTELEDVLPRRGSVRRFGESEPIPYPPGTDPTSGTVVIRHRFDGTVGLAVEPGQMTSGHPRVRELFETGALELADATDLRRFLTAELPTGPDPLHRGRSRATADFTRSVLAAALDRRPPTSAELAAAIGERVLGQQPALERLAGGVAFHLRKTLPRTCYSAMLLGPSGVGKTESTYALAEVLGWHRTQIDCGEITGVDQLNRVLGAAPGYVGFDAGSPLARALGGGDPAVLVFDEIEKAHPALLQSVLLGLLDRGRYTDPHPQRGAARTLDARSSIVLFTANLGADDREQAAGERTRLRRNDVRPELVGRLSDVITFDRLHDQDLVAIALTTVRRILDQFDLRLASLAPELIAQTLSSLDRPSGVRGLEVALEGLLREPLAAYLDRPDHCARVHLLRTTDGVSVAEATPAEEPARADASDGWV